MFEVVVIGGGPSGVIAALRARELGATVALIEREHLGGVSTNDGCVPTRVLARAARLMRDAEQFADYGLEGGPPTVDFVRLLNRTERIVETVHQKKQLRAHLEAADVRCSTGSATPAFSMITPSHSATRVACKARSSSSAWAVTRVGSPCLVASTP